MCTIGLIGPTMRTQLYSRREKSTGRTSVMAVLDLADQPGAEPRSLLRIVTRLNSGQPAKGGCAMQGEERILFIIFFAYNFQL